MEIHHLTLLLILASGLLAISRARLKCPSVYIPNGSYKVRSKGRIIIYKCSRGFYLFGEAYGACIKGKWDTEPPVCLKPGCPRPNNLLNGKVQESWRSSLLKFSCNPGYKLIGPSSIYCNGRYWNAAPPLCQAVDIKCDFEKKSPCNWIIDDYDDEDFNWRLQQHEPPSRVLKTGPLHDHTLSPNNTGHYLVLETSDYMPTSKPARIHSPVFPRPSGDSCFIFWYHMYGSTIGTLNVFLNNVLTFQKKGNHGDRWMKGIISFNENITNHDLQIIIEGTYGGGYTGDIGLDDFSIGNGSDCSMYTVKSCIGRCYEEKNDPSSCLCSPECSIYSSCCEDFLDVCSLESTTPFFEASTEVEDSTQVYSDTYGTTDYETSFSETPFNFTDSEFTEALESSTSSNSFTYSEFMDPIDLKTDAEQFEKTSLLYSSDGILNSSSEISDIDKHYTKSQMITNNISDTKLLYFSTTPYIRKEQQSTSPIEKSTILNKFSPSVRIIPLKNIPTSETSTLSLNKNDITNKNFFITTEATSNNYNNLFTTNSQIRRTHNQTTSTKAVVKKVTNFIGDTTTAPKVVSIKTLSFTLSSKKTIFPENKPENRERTNYSRAFKMDKLSSRGSDLKTNLTTLKSMLFTESTTPFHWTKVFLSTHVPYITSSWTSKSVTNSPYTLVNKIKHSTTAASKKVIPNQSSTNTALTHLKWITPALVNSKFYYNITTAIPQFYNVTVLTSDQANITTSKVDIKKEINDSHTHLQITSQLPPLFNTTKESASFTSIVKSTVTIKQNSVNSPKKWKSKYKPKDRFIFSAVQRNKDSDNKTYIILSTCAAVIGVISILLVALYIRRRRLMFVNEIEEADTDILYHSSQEMLDLHIARPNH